MKRTNVKKTILCLALCLIASLSCLLLSSCGTDESKQYDHLVTFDYNLGDKIEAACGNQYLGVMNNSLVGLKPSNRTDFEQATIQGYYLDGWYTAKVGENGEPLRDTETGMVVLDAEWDFETMRVTEDITLYAKLIRVAVMRYVDADLYATDPEKAVLKEKKDMPDTVINKPSSALAPKKKGYTLLEYYKDSACTELFAWPYTVTTEDVNVYVKFIEGDWQLVKDADGLKKALSKSGNNIYLLNDIDYQGNEWVYGEYNGKFNGNGYSIKNVNFERTCTKDIVGCGLFSILGEKANIYDVKFENVTIKFKVAFEMGEYKSGFLAYTAKKGAKITNVTVSGTLDCDYGSNKMSSATKWIANDESTSENCNYDGVQINERSAQA